VWGQWRRDVHGDQPAAVRSSVSVYRHRGERLYINETDADGAWVRPPALRHSIGAERTRRWDEREVRAFLTTVDQARHLAETLTMQGAPLDTIWLDRIVADWLPLIGDREFRMHVNLSPVEIRQSGLVEDVSNVLARYGSAGLRVIAEGVETEAQVAHLRALDCRYGQGFHLARPAPAEATTAGLERDAASGVSGAARKM
jgi:EAL domain-containing protein (putative c-di-GMP-specific phosphodiesterase class I)